MTLAERRQHLVRLVSLSGIHRYRLVQIFNDGDRLLAKAERMELQGIVSKRWAAPYKSGNSRDWIKVKTNAWRETNSCASAVLRKAEGGCTPGAGTRFPALSPLPVR